ncbi:CPBP family intramembrane metalloprotease [Sphingomonas changnyeongensis]|uniref:CPBP family intramembrane metalloprotease n=1 Tax=Sphingomonas changnyeongensis TaxID=2698679 RepID=A0A7Z2NVC5_9SPHN|nr:CPBP family intramembrane glutamic endopeptidase [Sphingomonas changnyeongensis]QHL90501.1 CPBP family intramembrane metalloprotease [Sphingomonas changnyeongensis]
MTAAGRRLALAAAIVAAWLAITLGVPRFQLTGEMSLQELVTRDVAWGVAAAALFLIVAVRLAGWRDLGFRAPRPRGWWRLLWMPALYLAGLAFLGGTTGRLEPFAVVMVLINTALVGFSEELAFRGILWGGARRALAFWPGFLLVSALFGSVHVLNAVLTGELAAAGVQALNAFMSGAAYLAIRIRTRSIIPIMAIHALWDFTVFLAGSGSAPAAPEAGLWKTQLLFGQMLTGPLFLYSLWLVRNERVRAGWRDDGAANPAQ